MTDQDDTTRSESVGLAKAASVPLFALLFALLLIYTRSPTGDPGFATWIRFPESLGGEHLRQGLRTIAILFGLSCLPGTLIGIMLSYLIVPYSRLTSASISLLRIGQWVPFVIWWVLVKLLFVPFNQPLSRYFFDWTMTIPAVALGVCHHFLSTRHLLQLDWRTSVIASAGMACHRALFISIILALSICLDDWVVIWSTDNIIKNYVAASVLALFLMIVNWIYRSGIEHSADFYRKI